MLYGIPMNLPYFIQSTGGGCFNYYLKNSFCICVPEYISTHFSRWFSKCGPQISSIHITGELVRNADSGVTPQTTWLEFWEWGPGALPEILGQVTENRCLSCTSRSRFASQDMQGSNFQDNVKLTVLVPICSPTYWVFEFPLLYIVAITWLCWAFKFLPVCKV